MDGAQQNLAQERQKWAGGPSADRGGTAFGTDGSANAGGIKTQRSHTAILTSVTTPASGSRPLTRCTTMPVRGANYDLGPLFGLATIRSSTTTPQQKPILFSVRV